MKFQNVCYRVVEILTYYSDDFNYTSVLARLVEVSLLMGDREKLEKAIELIYLKWMNLTIIMSIVMYMNFQNL